MGAPPGLERLWDVRPPPVPTSDENLEYRLEFTGYRWGLALEGDKIVVLSDLFHQTDQDEPVMGEGKDLLSFMVRALSAEFESDLAALKSLDVAITDNQEVELVFSNTIRILRNDYNSLYRMIDCMLYGVSAANTVKTVLSMSSLKRSKVVDHFVEKITELFDFSDIWTFISSYPVAVEKIVEDVSILTGVTITSER